MAEDLVPGALADQPGGVTEPGQQATGGGENTGIGENPNAQPNGDSGSGEGQPLLGPKELPPELESIRVNLVRDYHNKTQKLAQQTKEHEAKLARFEAFEQDSRMLADLMSQAWFRKAIDSEKARRSGQVPGLETMTADELAQLQQDPKRFGEFVDKRFEQLVEAKLGTSMNQVQEAISKIEDDKEFDKAAKMFPDVQSGFDAINDKGLLDPYFEQGYNPVAAYKQYWFDHERGRKNGASVEEEAERLLAQRKAGSVEKPGPASVSGARIIKAASFDDAFNKVYEAIQKGEQNVRVERA